MTHREVQAPPPLPTTEQTLVMPLSLLVLRATRCAPSEEGKEGKRGEARAQGSTPHALQSPARRGLDTRCPLPPAPLPNSLAHVYGGLAAPASSARRPTSLSVCRSFQWADWLPTSPLTCFLNCHCARLSACCCQAFCRSDCPSAVGLSIHLPFQCSDGLPITQATATCLYILCQSVCLSSSGSG